MTKEVKLGRIKEGSACDTLRKIVTIIVSWSSWYNGVEMSPSVNQVSKVERK